MDAKDALAAEEIANHRKLNCSQKIIDCRSRVQANAYASRYDALNVIYKDVQENTDVSVLGAFFDTKYLGEEKSRVMALGINEGVIRGFEDYTLGADCYVTRGEFAVMLARKAGVNKDAPIKHTFPDGSSWNEAALSWCYENGYMVGYPDGKFGSGDFLTKEQLIMITRRIQ